MKRAFSVLVISGLVLGASFYTIARPRTLQGVSPSSLLPQRTVVLLQVDGAQNHMPALKETAAWKSLEESGLRARIFDLVQMFISAGDPDFAPIARKTMDDLMLRGFSFSAAVSPNGKDFAPMGVLVLHNASDMQDLVTKLVLQANPDLGNQIQTRQQEGRTVSFISPQPGMEVCMWIEGEHLVIAAGIQPADRVLAAASGAEPNVTAHPLWAKLRQASGFTVDHVAWLDTKSLMAQFGDRPFPEPPRGKSLSIREFCEMLGIAELEGVTFSGGYKGVATWNKMSVIAPGPRTKLLKLLDQRNITFGELPPMPADTDNFMAGSFDIAGAVDLVLETINAAATVAGERATSEFELRFAEFQNVIGGHPRDVFSAGLGDLFCVYNDPTSMPLPVGIGPVLSASVRDRAVVTSTIRRLTELAQREADGEFSVREAEKDGATYFSFQISGGVPVVPTIMVTDKWVVASLMPGAAQSFAARVEGRLKSWEPGDEVRNALAALPSEFSSISVSDPRPGYRSMMTWAPMGMGMLEQYVLPDMTRGDRKVEMPFGIQDLPSAEELTEPLFPNVTVSSVTDAGVESRSRQSVPGIPLGNVGSAAALPVLVALLLPAIQSARAAARRTQSMNNLKMMSLALHIHHDTYGHFPRGTVENDSLKPDERLSWVVSILPFLEQKAAFDAVEKTSGWNSDANQRVSDIRMPVLTNPGLQDELPGAFNYVAISGIGPDSASLPQTSPKAGIFGYDRKTRFRDVLDGLSNTLSLAESTRTGVSYLRGGSSTVRGFSQRPYVNGPDGIGGPSPGGFSAALADGSVRFLSENIDPKVLEALATKAGNEVVNFP